MLIRINTIKTQKRFIFISNAKCASTSIEAVLEKYSHIVIKDPPYLKHMSYLEMVDNFDFLFSKSGFEPNTFYKFAIIREPIDWIVSWFNYRSREELKNSAHKDRGTYLGNVTFDDYINRIEEDWVKNQSDRFIDRQGKNAMDFMIRYENLEKDFQYVMNQIGIDETIIIPHKNKSHNVRITSKNISEKSINKIKVYFKQDYDFIKNLSKERILT